MRKWIFFSALASAGLVLPVAQMHVAHAETYAEPMDAPAGSEAGETGAADRAPAPGAPEQPALPQEALPQEEMDAAPTPDVAAPAPAAASEEYVVKQGDTLAEIALERLGSADEWRRIAQLNGIQDPTTLAVGTRLRLPPKDGSGPAGKTPSAERGGDPDPS